MRRFLRADASGPALLRGGALLAALLGAFLAPPTSRAASPIEDAFPTADPGVLREPARRVLERAFDNLYGCDVEEEIELTTRAAGMPVRNHKLRLVRKTIDGRAYLLVRFVTDNDYWDMRVLKIENADRSDDHFIWVPQLRRVRRFTSVQKADQFQGTDLTLEDLEVHRADKFEIVGRAFSVLRGEPVQVLTIEPLSDLGYRRAIMYVSQRDYATLEVHYYRETGGSRPYKVARAPREDMLVSNGHVLPQLWIFTDYQRGTETEARWHHLEVAEGIDKDLFTAARLESRNLLQGFGE